MEYLDVTKTLKKNIEHWRGFLAKTNMRICRDKLKGEYKD